MKTQGNKRHDDEELKKKEKIKKIIKILKRKRIVYMHLIGT